MEPAIVLAESPPQSITATQSITLRLTVNGRDAKLTADAHTVSPTLRVVRCSRAIPISFSGRLIV